jgi:hypothetical protein
VAEPTSHNRPARECRSAAPAPALAPLLAGLTLLAAALVCVEIVAGSELTRTLDRHLEHLADPSAWMH